MIIEGAYENGDFGEVRVDGQVLDLAPSLKVQNHSPDGFAWGYSGSGPAQLALAILLAAGLEKNLAITLYQRFKMEHLATLPRAPFTLEVDIPAFVRTFTPYTVTPTPQEPDEHEG